MAVIYVNFGDRSPNNPELTADWTLSAGQRTAGLTTLPTRLPLGFASVTQPPALRYIQEGADRIGHLTGERVVFERINTGYGIELRNDHLENALAGVDGANDFANSVRVIFAGESNIADPTTLGHVMYGAWGATRVLLPRFIQRSGPRAQLFEDLIKGDVDRSAGQVDVERASNILIGRAAATLSLLAVAGDLRTKHKQSLTNARSQGKLPITNRRVSRDFTRPLDVLTLAGLAGLKADKIE